MRRLTAAAAAACALLACFAVRFDPDTPQWGVDALWLAALAIWAAAIWSRRARGGARHAVHPAPLLFTLAVLGAAWLPFYDNWRWAFTADSLGWFEIPYSAAVSGISHNLFSVRGVDDNFTYLHSIASNSLMLLVEPTLFWHRVGKLLVSAAGLSAIYLFVSLTIDYRWALAVVIAIATNYVWLWFSYVSLGHIDSYVFAFLSLTYAALIRRQPDNRLLWMACGLTGGLALFFTQTAWAEVGVVGAALAIGAVRLRRPDLLGIYAFSFLLAAAPLLLQWPALWATFQRTAGPPAPGSYLLRIFCEILALPVTSATYELGVYEGFLRPPLDWLYVAGIGVAAAGARARWRQAWGIPAVAPVVLALLLCDAVLLTVTNNLYPNPSTKRVYHLIPYQVLLALLPLMVLQRLSRARGWPAWPAWLLTAAALAMSVVTNGRMVVAPPPTMYGFTVFDGLIELRQSRADRLVALFTSRGKDFAFAVLNPESVVAREYRLADTVIVEERIDAGGLAAAGAAGALLCYEPEFDALAFDNMITPYGALLVRVPLRNTWDLHCYDVRRVEGPRVQGSKQAPVSLEPLDPQTLECSCCSGL